MEVPRAAAIEIESAFEEAGYDRTIITQTRDGRNVVAIDMEGIAVIPVGDSDLCINSGRLADLLIAAGREAFEAGHEAAMKRTVPALMQDPTHNPAASREEGWSDYTPSNTLDEMQAQL